MGDERRERAKGGEDQKEKEGGGRDGRGTCLAPGWWVRLLFHKGPPGGGSGQQATSSGPSLGPDTLSFCGI